MLMKKSGTYVSEKKMMTLKLSFFCIACSWKNRDRNCIFHNFFQARWHWNNLANGIFPCNKLQSVFTEVNEGMHVLLNITQRGVYARGLEYCIRYWSTGFSHRVPSNLFQKLLLHIFEKRKRLVWQQGCLLRTGIWLSLHRNWRRMEVYQTWNSKAWYLEY